jgi:hypothetical protein
MKSGIGVSETGEGDNKRKRCASRGSGACGISAGAPRLLARRLVPRRWLARSASTRSARVALHQRPIQRNVAARKARHLSAAAWRKAEENKAVGNIWHQQYGSSAAKMASEEMKSVTIETMTV